MVISIHVGKIFLKNTPFYNLKNQSRNEKKLLKSDEEHWLET